MSRTESSAPTIHFEWEEKCPEVRIYRDSWEITDVLPIYQEPGRRKNQRFKTRMSGIEACGWTNGNEYTWNVLATLMYALEDTFIYKYFIHHQASSMVMS